VRRTPLTTQGAKKLRAEVQKLKSVDRPRIINAIAEARAHGDLKENAEYHAANAAIEQCLGEAEIIDVSRLSTEGRVVFGATLELYDMSAEAEVTYQIVGEMEADISIGLISISSPIGDEISFDAPGGARDYEIISVKYV
jgi:transcription elongation factor GreA